MLAQTPSIARHVQSLTVHPTSPSRTDPGPSYLYEGKKLGLAYAVSDAVRRACVRLDALRHFVWDGEEMPGYDDMWFALRMACPRLKSVGTSMGSYVPSRSCLFEFTGLTGFALTFKSGFFDDHIGMFLPDLPESCRLWHMLIHACPDLETLCIDGFSSHPTDARKLVQGRWPKLRALTLGDVVVDHLPGDPSAGDTKPPFVQFLEAHSELRTLRASRHALLPAHLTHISPLALPKLTSFSGTLEQLQALAPTHASSLTRIAFHEPMPLRDVTPLALSLALQAFPHLKCLRVNFVLGGAGHESGSLLRSMVGSLPCVETLHLGCAGKPSFGIEALGKSLRTLPRLRNLHITLVKPPGEIPPGPAARALVHANPRLEKLSITYLQRGAALPLPEPVLAFPVGNYDAHGAYHVQKDEHGHPLTLFAVERTRRLFPRLLLALRISPTGAVRRYTADLRPGAKAGRWGWRMLMERSKAGEEVRMLGCLGVLLGLSVWGFFVVGGEERDTS